MLLCSDLYFKLEGPKGHDRRCLCQQTDEVDLEVLPMVQQAVCREFLLQLHLYGWSPNPHLLANAARINPQNPFESRFVLKTPNKLSFSGSLR